MILARLITLASLASVAMLTGCSHSRWHLDYEKALQEARTENKSILILYKDSLETESGRMRDILESPKVARTQSDKAWCMLVPFYAPNRQFMAQFGVHAAPAIVVVRPDLTFHALRGLHDESSVESFLAKTDQPGSRPQRNIAVPRRANLRFFNVYDRALRRAERQNRRLVVVYKWWLDGASTAMISRMYRPHVSRYLSETVNCVLDWDHAPNRRIAGRYGVTEYPAIILVEPDGTSRSLVRPQSDEAIIRFLAAD
jgi:hypothetical protein